MENLVNSYNHPELSIPMQPDNMIERIMEIISPKNVNCKIKNFPIKK